LNVREARMKDLRITIDLRIMRGSHGVRVSVFMPRERYHMEMEVKNSPSVSLGPCSWLLPPAGRPVFVFGPVLFSNVTGLGQRRAIRSVCGSTTRRDAPCAANLRNLRA
jgi:hypothetical protein